MSGMRYILESHPFKQKNHIENLIICIHECFNCQQSCEACADACLEEKIVSQLRRSIRLSLDCAEVCEATAKVLIRQTGNDFGVVHSMLETTIGICEMCAEELNKFEIKHCKIARDTCVNCRNTCQYLLKSLLAEAH